MSETLPYAWYSDDELLRRERSLIFARSWQYAGRAEQVAKPGSFLATDAGGVPILVTRDATGMLRALLNVCRHRGAVLTEGCGERSTIQCHYHAWTYDLDGSLRSAPRAEREPGFERGAGQRLFTPLPQFPRRPTPTGKTPFIRRSPAPKHSDTCAPYVRAVQHP